MRKLNFYLEFGYYVRLDQDDYEAFEKKSRTDKFIANRQNRILYEFIRFKPVGEWKWEWPKTITNIEIESTRTLCHNPIGDFSFPLPEIKGIINVNDEDNFSINVTDYASSNFARQSVFYTNANSPWVKKIDFSVDPSRCNLTVRIEYSDKKQVFKRFIFISRMVPLETPDYYYLFEPEKSPLKDI